MEVLMSRFSINNKSKILNHLPVHHSDGLNQGLLLTFVSAAELVVPENVNLQSVGDVLDLVYKKKISHFITVPTVIAMIYRLGDDYINSFSYPEFKVMESTAGYLNKDLWTNFEKRFGIRITNCYGLTETVCEVTYAGPDDESHKIGTVGKPDGFELRLISEDNIDVSQGDVGELLLKGDGLFSCYFNNPKATKEAFIDGWFRTGDLATIDENKIVKIVGRKKNVIIRGSISIFPEDINFHALRCEGISEVVTVGLPDEVLGERVIVVATSNFAEASKIKELLFHYLRTAISTERQPDDIFIFDQLPYGPSGKVDLKKVIQDVKIAEKVSSHSQVLETVIKIAAKAFGVPETTISASDNQDSISTWDSLRFLTFVMLLEKEFNIQISAKDVININNLYDASEIIKLQI
jgi:long-chain acyl-CoA synthetase